jgi:hypothetical protein
MNDISHCIMGALIILNMIAAKRYANRNKLEYVIILCTTSIIITILMCCLVMNG